jgi:hypothetical protein
MLDKLVNATKQNILNLLHHHGPRILKNTLKPYFQSVRERFYDQKKS